MCLSDLIGSVVRLIEQYLKENNLQRTLSVLQVSQTVSSYTGLFVSDANLCTLLKCLHLCLLFGICKIIYQLSYQ